MNTVTCLYPDRDAVLVAYLYDDIDPADRVAFETHVATCLPCRGELAELRGVRATLGQWAPPEPARSSLLNFESRASRIPNPTSRWHSIPVWAQVAAAMLVLGVSASVANLDVRYDRNGLTVRTGWSAPVTAPVAPPQAAQAPVPDAAAWRADLSALQSQLRAEIRQASQSSTVTAQSTAPATLAGAMSDAEFQRRVRVLLTESEKKQEQDLALHLVQLQRDFNAQRTADIRRTNQLFRDVMSTYGDEIAKQQRQINYLVPASPQR